jgi:hypothetical protein
MPCPCAGNVYCPAPRRYFSVLRIAHCGIVAADGDRIPEQFRPVECRRQVRTWPVGPRLAHCSRRRRPPPPAISSGTRCPDDDVVPTDRDGRSKKVVRSPVARSKDRLLLPSRSITSKDIHDVGRKGPCDRIVSTERDRATADVGELGLFGPCRSGALKQIRGLIRSHYGPICAECHALPELRKVYGITGRKYALLCPVRPIAMENIGPALLQEDIIWSPTIA